MDFGKLKEDFKVGKIDPAYIDFLKYTFINNILDAKTQVSAGALVGYAVFLNKNGIDSDNYPVYLRVLFSNHQVAIDYLLDNHEPEEYLDCVIPNHYLRMLRLLLSYGVR